MKTTTPINFALQSSLLKTPKRSHCRGIAALSVFCICAVLISGCSPKADLTLSGTVVDSTTGEPIAGARVEDDGYGSGTCKGDDTDAQGKYEYNTWPEEHNIIATAPGYQPQQKIILTRTLHREKELEINFALIPAPETTTSDEL